MTEKQDRISELSDISSAPDFWNDQNNAQKIMQELNTLRAQTEKVTSMETLVEESLELIDMAIAEKEEETFFPEIKGNIDEVEKQVEKMELATMLNGAYDDSNVFLNIHPGAGGTESQDWADMLLRMYVRWAERKSFKVEFMDYQEGDEAGIKSVTLHIIGENAYGYLRGEKGVHRLVRISPFDAAGRRHTSFTSVDIVPDIEGDIEVEIRPEDLKIDTYRSSGAGGQHVNKTESAIRITHLPSGIVVSCQTERSQFQNKDYAMKMLRAKLYELYREEQMSKMAAIKGTQLDIAWGSQIRSYVFCPYTMVKDHRTNVETGNVQAVMDGELDMFVEGYLKSDLNKAMNELEAVR